MAISIPVESIEVTNLQQSQVYLGEGDGVTACTFDARRGTTSFIGLKAYVTEGRFVVDRAKAIGAGKIAKALESDPGFHMRAIQFLNFLGSHSRSMAFEPTDKS